MHSSDEPPLQARIRHRARSLATRVLSGLILLAVAPLASAQITVSIAASDASASESPEDGAEFVVSRSGGSPFATPAVDYAVSGTATNGEDYAALSG